MLRFILVNVEVHAEIHWNLHRVYWNICILTLTFIQDENEIYSCTEVYTGVMFLQDDSEVYAARSWS